jgi:hypothetical protein
LLGFVDGFSVGAGLLDWGGAVAAEVAAVAVDETAGLRLWVYEKPDG